MRSSLPHDETLKIEFIHQLPTKSGLHFVQDRVVKRFRTINLLAQAIERDVPMNRQQLLTSTIEEDSDFVRILDVPFRGWRCCAGVTKSPERCYIYRFSKGLGVVRSNLLPVQLSRPWISSFLGNSTPLRFN
jgi:hypothetical protein